MVIGGIQKLSLIDFPGKIATVVFTQGCDFLCSFCHNPALVPFCRDSAIAEEDIFDYLSTKKTMIEGVCITGGEPTGQPDLPEFIEKVKNMGFFVKLDTNGSNPAMLEALFARGLVDYIAMDIKAAWGNYPKVIRSLRAEEAAEKAKKSLSIISSSSVDHEFRTTVFPGVHKVADFLAIASYLRDGEKYFIQDINLKKTLGNIVVLERLPAPLLTKEVLQAFPKLRVFAR